MPGNDVFSYDAAFIPALFAMKNISNHLRSSITKRGELFACLFLFVATLAVYSQVTDFDFVNYDDPRYVYENDHVMSGLTWEGVGWAFTTTYAEFWHPLTWLSHMLDYHMFGENPAGHHLSNLLLHLANTVLFFLLLNRMTQAMWQSTFVAALFALHPLHVESVAWVAQRKDLLSVLFWMLTLHAYFQYARNPRFARYLLVVLLFALGLMAKPMLVTLPGVMLLLDYWPLGRLTGQQWSGVTGLDGSESAIRPGWRKRAVLLILEKAPLFILAGIFSVLTLVAQHKGVGLAAAEDFPLGVRMANGFVSYWEYVRMNIWPRGLAPFYPFFGEMPPFWQWGGAACLLVLVSVLAVRFGAKYPYLPVGWFWFLGTLLPVIGLIQIGRHAIADRYTYITINGLFVVIAWGVPELLGTMPYRRIVLWATAAAVLVACLITTTRQASYWQDNVTLFEHTLGVTSNNYLAHNNLASALIDKGETDDAIRHFLEVLRIRPDDERVHNNLGAAFYRKGNVSVAIQHFEKALQLNPHFTVARENLHKVMMRQKEKQ